MRAIQPAPATVGSGRPPNPGLAGDASGRCAVDRGATRRRRSAAGLRTGRRTAEIAGADQVGGVLDDQARPIDLGSGLDTTGRLDRVAGLDEPQELGRLAGQDDPTRGTTVVEGEAVRHQLDHQAAHLDAVAEMVDETAQIGPRRARHGWLVGRPGGGRLATRVAADRGRIAARAAVRSRGRVAACPAEGDVRARARLHGEATVGRAGVWPSDDPHDRRPAALDQCRRRDPGAGQTDDRDPTGTDPQFRTPAIAQAVDLEDGPGHAHEPPLEGDRRRSAQRSGRGHRRCAEVDDVLGQDARGVVGTSDVAHDPDPATGRGSDGTGRDADLDGRRGVLDDDPSTGRVEQARRDRDDTLDRDRPTGRTERTSDRHDGRRSAARCGRRVRAARWARSCEVDDVGSVAGPQAVPVERALVRRSLTDDPGDSIAVAGQQVRRAHAGRTRDQDSRSAAGIVDEHRRQPATRRLRRVVLDRSGDRRQASFSALAETGRLDRRRRRQRRSRRDRDDAADGRLDLELAVRVGELAAGQHEDAAGRCGAAIGQPHEDAAGDVSERQQRSSADASGLGDDHALHGHRRPDRQAPDRGDRRDARRRRRAGRRTRRRGDGLGDGRRRASDRGGWARGRTRRGRRRRGGARRRTASVAIGDGVGDAVGVGVGAALTMSSSGFVARTR